MRDIERKFNEKLKEWLRRDENKVSTSLSSLLITFLVKRLKKIEGKRTSKIS